MSVVWDKPTRSRLCTVCGHKSSCGAVCAFCRCEEPDPHSRETDEAMTERYS